MAQLHEQNDRLSNRPSDAPTHGRDVDLRELLDKMPAMLGYWDRDQRNRFCNKAYSAWFGLEHLSEADARTR